MTPSKFALIAFSTASAVVMGTAGMAWLSHQSSMSQGHSSDRGSLSQLRDSIAGTWADHSPRASQSMVLEEKMRPTSQAPSRPTQELGIEMRSSSKPGLVNASTDVSQNAMIASQKLIRTGQLSLQVKLFDESFAKLQRIAAENGGYVAEISANRQDHGRASGTVVVRVQPARYFQTLDALRTIGKVEQEGVATQDVTKEYADLEARLTNKQQLEARMRDILRTRASKMEDLLEAEQQLSQVTEQIE